jgi:alpha-amylase
MVDICIYFQVHQPDRLKKYTYFDIGYRHDYEDNHANREILLKVANKCYLPACNLLLHLIKRYEGAFKVAFSLSGIFIEQCKRYSPETLDAFKRLADTGCVEFLNETYYHSLSFLFSTNEFKEQVELHRDLIAHEFGYHATTFRNTELIYNNDIAKCVEELGYKTILAEGTEKILDWRSSGFVYRPHGCDNLKLLLRNYRLTDDVGFRFSDRNWSEYPLLAEKYAYWLHSLSGQADVVNLFMDFETFGEHQWHDTGIFAFLEKLPEQVLLHPEYSFATPAEVSSKYKSVAELDVPYPVSWADIERDLTAWYGNDLQKDALHALYILERDIKQLGDEGLLRDWRIMQTSDHFYYMCIKYNADGDVHKYFNPYHSPYDAYINYQNILADLTRRVAELKEARARIPVQAQLTDQCCSCSDDTKVQSSQVLASPEVAEAAMQKKLLSRVAHRLRGLFALSEN